MRRLVVWATLIVLTLGLVAPNLTSAQTGTPVSQPAGAFGTPMGTAVPFIGSDGTPIGTITVNSITDPFDGFDSYSAPQRGYHYALADVSVTNTSNRPFDLNAGSFTAIDSDGFVVDQAYLSYTDPSVVELSSVATLAPGETATGVIPYSLFGAATIQGMIYSPSYDRAIIVLDQRTAPVEIGTTVSIMNTSGAEAAQVTVNSVVAPFEGFDSYSAPARGSSYVAIDVTVTNTGTGVLSVSPSDFIAIDADGFVLSSAFVSRTDTTIPDYDYIDLASGESQTGMIFYQTYQGVPVAKIAYGDGYTTLSIVADIDASSTTGTASTGTETIPATTVAPALATEVTGSAVASNPDCAGLVEWGTDLSDRLGRAVGLVMPFQTSDVSTLDAATVRDVGTQLRALGDEQAASNPPAIAVELNTLMTEKFYYALADAVDQIATALEQNNAAAAISGQMTAMGVTQVFAEDGPYYTATQAIGNACPVEMQQLDQQGS